jgi:electron transport complex protein RnfC
MLITKLKDREEIISFFDLRPFVFKCFGCKEVYFPEEEVDRLIEENRDEITGAARVDYLCREEFSKVYIEKVSSEIEKSGGILVFSCGVGVQVIAKLCEGKKVLAGCDTYYLNGFQGLSVQNSGCQQCGECYLNHTGGICPITACSKGLLNGPCGGAKNGKCEVSPDMDCGWELIYKRLKEIGKEEILKKKEVFVRDYQRIITEKPVVKE